MPARILDGTKIAHDIRSEVAAEVKTMAAAGVRPGLAVVLVGHNPASEIYVRGKVKACQEVGLYSEQHTPPETATTTELLALIDDLNHRDAIDGILVQLPLPPQVDSKKVLMAVDPAKDVDGFHPVNVGFLSTQRPGLVPMHARRSYRNSQAQPHPHRRPGSRRRRPQRHRRQTHRYAAAQRQRYGHRLSFENP